MRIAKLLNLPAMLRKAMQAGCYIARKCSSNHSGFTRHKTAPGFTLIELLIVIGVLGVLSAAVLTVIDVTSQINKANLAKSETFDASIQNSLSINLVGEWTFSGNTNDTSGYGNNGTLSGPGGANNLPQPTADRKGQSNKAYSFDGTDDYVDAGSDASLKPTSAITVSVWVNSAGQQIQYAAPVSSEDYPTKGYVIDTTGTAGGPTNVVFKLGRAAGWTGVGATTSLTAGVWYHLVGTYDSGTGALRIYVNGVLEGSGTPTGTIGQSVRPLWIGSSQQNPGRRWKGKIDDVRVYSQAFSLSQVQQLYARGLIKHQLARR